MTRSRVRAGTGANAAGDLLRRGGLRVVVQPLVDLRSGEVRQVEALARLRVEQRWGSSLLAPAAFLDRLTGDELDLLVRDVVDRALAASKAWEAKGLRLVVSVNLAPSTLRDPRCAGWVSSMLERHSVGPERLVLELLETDVLDTSAQVRSLARLRGLGVAIALDDFGSGHSNASRLQALNVDVVKIDRSLTAGLLEAARTRSAMVRLIELGRTAGCEVVVEGLERSEQVDAVRTLGADLGQGFYFARPMAIDQLPGWAAGRRASPGQRGASG